MENEYKQVKRLIFTVMRLVFLGVIAWFGLTLNTMGQTLVTNPLEGHYCEGGTGVSICVENTVMGQNYYVMHNGDTVNCIVGNGLTVCCAGFTDPGIYTTLPPTNTVTVYVDPLPVLPTVVGDFYLCGHYNLTTYVTYENLPTSDYTFTWQAFGYLNGGAPAMGFYALPDENTLDVIWGNADYGTIVVTAMDNVTGCENTSEIYTVNICPEITDNVIGDDVSICYGTSACFWGLDPDGGCDELTYLWQVSTDGNTWMAAWCCNPMANDTTNYCTPNLPGPATYFLRRIVTGLACESISNIVTLNVYAEFIPGVIAPDQTICYNTLPDALYEITPATGGDGVYTYQWQQDVNCFGNWVDIPGATNPGFQPPVLTDTTCYRRVDMNICDTLYTNEITINVWDLFIPGVICEDQSICNNTVPDQMYFCTPPLGGEPNVYTYQWQNDINCLGNWVDIVGATSSTYQPSALTDTTCYRVVVMNICDTLYTNTVTKIVWDEFILEPFIPSQDTSICYNTSPDCLGPVLASGGECDGNILCYSYQWYDDLGPISGATNPSYCPPDLTATNHYYCEVTDSSCGTLTSETITITVWDEFDPGIIGFVPDECATDSVAICNGTVPPCITFCAPYPSGGQPGIYSFQWFDSPDGTIFTPIVDATNDSLCPPALTQSTYYKCQVTNLCATGVTNIVKVHVWDEFFAGNIGFEPWCLDKDTVCYNTAPDCIIECIAPLGGNTVDGYTYKWFESVDNLTFVEIAGEINPGYCLPALMVDHWYYRLDINECGSLSTDTVHVMVWPEFIAGSIGNDQVICYNTVPDSLVELTPAMGGDGIYTYQWQIDVNCLGNWADIAGATEAGYQPPALTDTTCYRRMDMNYCDTLPTNIVTINVWDDLESGVIGDDQTICNNTIPDLLYFISTPSGGECNDVSACYTYQWQESVNCTGTWADITGANNDTYQPLALTDTTCYKVIVTDFCGVVETNVIQINVYDPLDVGIIGFDYLGQCLESDTVCYNTAPSCIGFCIEPSGGEPGLYTYQWMSSDSPLANFVPILGEENPEYCPPALTETTYYKCQVTNPCEVGVTNIVTAFVWDSLTAGDICLDYQEICYNTIPQCLDFCVLPDGGDTIVGYSYQWYGSTDGSVFNMIPGGLFSQYCPPALLTDMWYYCEVTNPCGVLNTDTAYIEVWDEFEAGKIGFGPLCLVNDTICKYDTPICIDSCDGPTGGSPYGYYYEWYMSIDFGITWNQILGETGSGYCPPALDTTTWFKRYDMNECDSIFTDYVEVFVHELPPPFEIVGDTMVCAYTSAQYCVDPPNDDPYSYSWSVQGGLLDPEQCCDTCAIIDWGIGPIGIITVIKEDLNTGCILVQTLEVQINPIPTPIITGPEIVDEGDTVTYSVQYVDNWIYSWFLTGGVTISGGGTNTIQVVWGPAGIGSVMVSAKDNSFQTECCGVAQLDVTINPVGAPDISGNVTYNNIYNTELNAVDIDLKNGVGMVVQSTSTDFDFTYGNGYYDFYNVPDDNYTLGVTTGIPFGGVNATDALAIKLHAIAQPGFILTGLPLECADVNASGTVNATDALYVVYRTINYISEFPAGEWAFDNVTLTMAGTPIVSDFMGQCYGDVNGSYIPTGYKSGYNYELMTDGILNIKPGAEFDLPVRIDRQTKMGAMTMFFNYSDELVEVVDVITPDNDNMLYTINNNSIRIAWSNTEALNLSAEDVIVTLKLKAVSDLTSDDQLLTLGNEIEFADEFANILDELTLKTLKVETSEIGDFAMSHNFPNPFSEYTDIEYTIPEGGKVVLNVFDILGNKVATLVDASQEAGVYKVRFFANDNDAGVYIYELQVESENSEFRDLKKMIIK